MSKLCRSCKMLQRVMISSRMDGTSYINLHSACVSPSLPADNVSEPAACSVLMSFASVGKSVPDGSMDTDLHGYEYGSEMLDPRITHAIAYLFAVLVSYYSKCCTYMLIFHFRLLDPLSSSVFT